jgi:hypothetical protein
MDVSRGPVHTGVVCASICSRCRVLSVKLRASFYHIFCLFHNQPPVTTTNMTTTDARAFGAPPLPLSLRSGNGHSSKRDPPGLSPPSKRSGKQPALREPIDSIVSETSFVTNPYAAGGPVGTPSPGPPINAPPGLNPIPIPQPSSFILPPLNFVPLASGYFTTATQYATSFLHGSHPLRLSVALEHSAFLWDCLHDHDASRRVARRAIKDVYRAQEAMEDTEFEDAAELVGILGRMMKRKSWEGTPRVGGMASPEPVTQGDAQASGGGPDLGTRAVAPTTQRSPPSNRRAAEDSRVTDPAVQVQFIGAVRSRANTASKSTPRQKESTGHENSPRSATQRHAEGGSRDITPRIRHVSIESGASTTPRAPQGVGGRSPTTPSTVRTAHRASGSGGSSKGTPVVGSSTSLTQSAAATLASDNMRTNSSSLRRSPPIQFSPEHHGAQQESSHSRQQR